ncbi:DUF5686 family protein, partial [Bacteroidota bacterium]
SEANEKDEAFWNEIRTIPLTTLEKRDYQIKDSIEVVKESKVYKDSIDKKNNKLAWGNLLYGYTYKNSKKNYTLYFQTPLTTLQYNTVEGGLADYEIRFAKTDIKKGSRFSVSWRNRYGLQSGRYYSKARVRYRFNRDDRMHVWAEAGHYTQQFNSDVIPIGFNSLYSLLAEENYAKMQEHSFGKAGWGMEVLNGFKVNTYMYFGERRELRNASKLGKTFVDYPKKQFTINEPANVHLPVGSTVFDGNISWVWTLELQYQPGLKYIERPNGKINLGTPWPMFTLIYKKGIGGFGRVKSDFDQLNFRVSDNHSLGMAGSLEWQVEAGWFPNNKFVPFMDWQHFNTSRVHIVGTGLNKFSALPYYIASTNQFFVQAHLEHHFHGAVLNKIPLIKKLKWQVVGGMHYLYEPSFGNYWEVIVGIENIFKIVRVDFVFPFRERNFQQFTFRFQVPLPF